MFFSPSGKAQLFVCLRAILTTYDIDYLIWVERV
jgi:hypothetical protein